MFERDTCCSVGVILFGAAVAGIRDYSYETRGYALVLLSNVTTAIYLATISRIGRLSLEITGAVHHTGWSYLIAFNLFGSVWNMQKYQQLLLYVTNQRCLWFSAGRSTGLNSFGLMWCNGSPDSYATLVSARFLCKQVMGWS